MRHFWVLNAAFFARNAALFAPSAARVVAEKRVFGAENYIFVHEMRPFLHEMRPFLVLNVVFLALNAILLRAKFHICDVILTAVLNGMFESDKYHIHSWLDFALRCRTRVLSNVVLTMCDRCDRSFINFPIGKHLSLRLNNFYRGKLQIYLSHLSQVCKDRKCPNVPSSHRPIKQVAIGEYYRRK